MAEHFHLLATIVFGGCEGKELEYMKCKIVENIEYHSSHAHRQVKDGPYNILHDGISYNILPVKPQSWLNRDIYYYNVILNLHGHNYNMNEEYWLTFFNSFFNEKEFVNDFIIEKIMIQLDFNGGKVIYITKSNNDDTYNIEYKNIK